MPVEKKLCAVSQAALAMVAGGAVLLSSCSHGGGDGDKYASVSAYIPDTDYAKTLTPCTREDGQQRSCTLQTLPPLGWDGSAPDKQAVLERLVVSHAWMGQRFAEVLDELPNDILALFSSVTAIVIASDVRPSYYWQRTGAIYLDPAMLWLTVDEKRVIDPAPDFRSDFGNALQFRVYWRYVKDNQYAWYSYSLEDNSERRLADIIPAVARLLFHELAHAADFMPVDEMPNLDVRLTMQAAVDNIYNRGRQPSQELTAMLPLQSELMSDLARVSFAGRDPNEMEQQLQPGDVSAEFFPDVASDDYSYFTRYEDLAMLFEETMMGMHFAIDRDVAVVFAPSPGEDAVIDSGQRRRISEERVAQRISLIGSRLLPEVDFNSYFANADTPEPLPSGVGWFASLSSAAKQGEGRSPPPARPHFEIPPTQMK